MFLGKNTLCKKLLINHLSLYLLVFFSVGCVYSTEETVSKFENHLESFIGKNMREVILYYGQPTKYKNPTDSPVVESGTFMIYDYRSKNIDCVLVFKYAKKTLKIIDWDYEGNCMTIKSPVFFGML